MRAAGVNLVRACFVRLRSTHSSALVSAECLVLALPQDHQIPCFLTHTTPETNKIVAENLHLSIHIRETVKGQSRQRTRLSPSLSDPDLLGAHRYRQVHGTVLPSKARSSSTRC